MVTIVKSVVAMIQLFVPSARAAFFAAPRTTDLDLEDNSEVIWMNPNPSSVRSRLSLKIVNVVGHILSRVLRQSTTEESHIIIFLRCTKLSA